MIQGIGKNKMISLTPDNRGHKESSIDHIESKPSLAVPVKLRYIRDALYLVYRNTRLCTRQAPLFEKPLLLLLLLLLLSITYEYNSTHIGFSSANVFRYMILQDGTQLARVLIHMALFALHSALCITAKTFVVSLLTRKLRESLTDALHQHYFGRDSYYRLCKLLDNPDQRVTLDVQEFSTLAVKTLDKFLLSPALISYFSYQVYSATGLRSLLGLYAFFVIGLVLQRLLVPLLIRQTKRMDEREGDYRFAQATLRNVSEAVYLSKSGPRFRKEVGYWFSRILDEYPRLLGLQFIVDMVGNVFAYAGGVANYVILFFCLDMSAYSAADLSALISQGSFMTLMLISKLTEFVQIGSHFSQMAAYSQRIVEFNQLAQERDYYLYPLDNHNETLETALISQPPTLQINFVDVCLTTPDEQCHIRDFNLRILSGENVFITGPNGSGKTSLVRLLMGMWGPSRGRVLVQGGARLSCAPQQTIYCSGTLLDQLTCCSDGEKSKEILEETEIYRVLQAVKLTSIVARAGGFTTFHTRSRWSELLSPGELQRLVLCRVLLEHPTFAILDEATSAVDLETEAAIYGEFWRRGITTISIAHRLDPVLAERIAIFVTFDGQGNHFIRRQGEQLAFQPNTRRSLS